MDTYNHWRLPFQETRSQVAGSYRYYVNFHVRKSAPAHSETIDTLSIGKMTKPLGVLTISEVCSLLKERGLDDDVIEIFRTNKIDGAVFLELNKEDLKELGIVALGDLKKIRNIQPPVAEVSSL